MSNRQSRKPVRDYIIYANVSSEIGIKVYCTKIRLLLEYASPVWGGLPKYMAVDLQHMRNRSLDISGIPRDTLPTLEKRREDATKREARRILNDNEHPNRIFVTNPTIYKYNLRTKPSPLPISISGTN